MRMSFHSPSVETVLALQAMSTLMDTYLRLIIVNPACPIKMFKPISVIE